MAKFARKEIRGIIGDACTDEIENQIMALHLGVVDPMKDAIAEYKAQADKLEDVQKELDELKAKGDGGYKEKYEKAQKAFDDYKADIEAKESRAAKEKAVKAYFESQNITGSNLTIAMRGAKDEIEGIELDADGKIKDNAALHALVKGEFAGLVVKTTREGVSTPKPPQNTGGTPQTREQIMAIKDTTQRQRAIMENMELFRKG